MGVINLSPDSFSGDGLGEDVDTALTRAEHMVGCGADIIDVGGESTRPEAQPVEPGLEMSLVLPVIKRLAMKLAAPISIDTSKSEVAAAAISAGASIINDVTGLKGDPGLSRFAGKSGAMLIVTSNQRDGRRYKGDIVEEITCDLTRAIRQAEEDGVSRENIIVDPGIGFGKTVDENLEILRRLGELRVLGQPILVGPSRKSFIGQVLGLPPDSRLEGTAAAVAISISEGADIVRVHDVGAMARVCRMSDAIIRGRK